MNDLANKQRATNQQDTNFCAGADDLILESKIRESILNTEQEFRKKNTTFDPSATGLLVRKVLNNRETRNSASRLNDRDINTTYNRVLVDH